jgi:hypothetical protein
MKVLFINKRWCGYGTFGLQIPLILLIASEAYACSTTINYISNRGLAQNPISIDRQVSTDHLCSSTQNDRPSNREHS